MVIDARESKILVRARAQDVEQLLAGGVGIERAARHLFEQILEMFV